MANRIEEIEKIFLSKDNYEAHVGWTTILFETCDDDSSSVSYRRMCEKGVEAPMKLTTLG